MADYQLYALLPLDAEKLHNLYLHLRLQSELWLAEQLIGLLQTMPETVRDYEVKERYKGLKWTVEVFAKDLQRQTLLLIFTIRQEYYLSLLANLREFPEVEADLYSDSV